MLIWTDITLTITGQPSLSTDAHVPGQYHCLVDPTLSPQDQASAALDALHENLPIRQLDDFTIEVFDQHKRPLIPGDALGYTLGHRAEYLGPTF